MDLHRKMSYLRKFLTLSLDLRNGRRFENSLINRNFRKWAFSPLFLYMYFLYSILLARFFFNWQKKILGNFYRVFSSFFHLFSVNSTFDLAQYLDL